MSASAVISEERGTILVSRAFLVRERDHGDTQLANLGHPTAKQIVLIPSAISLKNPRWEVTRHAFGIIFLPFSKTLIGNPPRSYLNVSRYFHHG